MKNLKKKILKFSLNILTILILGFFLGSGVILAQDDPGNPSFNDIVDDAENSNPGDPNDDPMHSDTGAGPTSNSSPAPNINTVSPTPLEAIGDYTLLAPLGDDLTTFDVEANCAFGKYLDVMINIFIGICAVLAMLMIVIGGIEYMTSELVSSKEHGKNQIAQAVFGLLLALGAWLLLNAINPNLLRLCLDKLPNAPIILEGDENAGPYSPASPATLASASIYCPGTGGEKELLRIAQSFQGKVTYSQAKRNTKGDGTYYLDCSSFVKQVYDCAGLELPGNGTASMLPGAEKINRLTLTSVNGKDLKPGDVLGWMKGESAKFPRFGHVIMYLGPGTFIEVSGGDKNKAVKIRPMTAYQNELRYVIRVADL